MQEKFSSELLKPFEGSKLGWLTNSVVQSLPKGAVFKEKGIRLLPESIFLSLVVLLLVLSALRYRPRACPSFSPQLASPAGLGEDHLAPGKTLYSFISTALSPRVQRSPCGAPTFGLPPACFPPSGRGGLGMKGMVEEHQSP